MFKRCFSPKRTSVSQCVIMFFAIVLSIFLLTASSLNTNLPPIFKTLLLLGGLGLSFVGVLYFLNIFPPFSHFCAFLSNLVLAVILLWVRQSYDSTSNLALLFNLIAYCSMCLALCFGGWMLVFESLVFFYVALIYALFDFSMTFWGFCAVLVVGFYFALKSQSQWVKAVNFLNLFFFISLVFFFKQTSWLILLWVTLSAIFLTHKIFFLSSSAVDKLTLISLALLVLLLEGSDFLISNILQENWVWIFAFTTLALLLWLEEMQFVAVFILLLIGGIFIEPYLVWQEEAHLYYWLLFFMIWLEFTMKWLVLGFFMLCFFVLFQYLSIDESYSNLGIFLTLSCVALLTTIIMRSKNAI